MPQLIDTTIANLRWQVVPEYREILLDGDRLRIDEWLAAGQAHFVKHGPHRTVYRVDLPTLRFFVKHYRLPDSRAWLRGLVRPSKARMEHDRALAIDARGVPTVTPLALGEAPGWAPGESILITLALEETEPLNQFLESTLVRFEQGRQVRLRQSLARGLAGLIARMHDAGIRHSDLHAGNILIRIADDDEPILHLIDVHAVDIGRPLSWEMSRDNLVILNRWFAIRSHRSDRRRFWQAYCQRRQIRDTGHGRAPGLFSKWATGLEARTLASNLVFWRKRDRRCLERNRYYRRIHTATLEGFAVADLDHAAMRELLIDPDAPFRSPGATVLKDSRSATVVEIALAEPGRTPRVICKRFRVASVADPWKALFRRPPALRSWVSGQGLRERCLPTPRPLALFHRRRGGVLREAYLLTEKISDAVDLGSYLACLASLANPRPLLRKRIEQLARLVAVMHNRGVCHNDLKAVNVLVSASAVFPSLNEDFGPFCLIDLAAATLGTPPHRQRRCRDLIRLHASFHQHPALTRTDKLRFLRNYLRHFRFAWRRSEWKQHWKRWWHAIDRGTKAKIARNIRNGRPLA